MPTNGNIELAARLIAANAFNPDDICRWSGFTKPVFDEVIQSPEFQEMVHDKSLLRRELAYNLFCDMENVAAEAIRALRGMLTNEKTPSGVKLDAIKFAWELDALGMNRSRTQAGPEQTGTSPVLSNAMIAGFTEIQRVVAATARRHHAEASPPAPIEGADARQTPGQD